MWKWPMQAWLQATQARISSSRPAFALLGRSGSQISARVMPQASACPDANARSASCGWLMRPPTSTGTDTTRLTAAANGTVYAFSTVIGGTMCTDPASVAEEPAVTLT